MEINSRTILLVEDQIIAAAPAIKVLKKAGYDVIYVLSGEKAIVIVESGVPIDLIVMDIDLGPGICGMAASKEINFIREVPILFFTSHSEEYILENIGSLLSVNYLSKKNNFTSLVHSIENIFFPLNISVKSTGSILL